jgi:hypothetical protein
MIATESITLSARWSLAVRELDLHAGDECLLLPDLAAWAIEQGLAVRCIGVKCGDWAVGRHAVRVVRVGRAMVRG